MATWRAKISGARRWEASRQTGRRRGQRRAAVFGIAHAIDVERQTGARGGAQQEFLDFVGPLVVPPIANPDKALARAGRFRRLEQPRVRSFVPNKYALAPAPTAIDFSQRGPEGQHAVVAIEIIAADRIWIADRAMMRVVKQQSEASPLPPHSAERRDQPRLVPFVDNHQISVVNQGGQIDALAVFNRGKLGICRAIGVETRLAMIAQELREAPTPLRLVGDDLMPRVDQLAQHAAQEMRVAVIPARSERMGEIADLHAALSQAPPVRLRARISRCQASNASPERSKL